MATQAAEPFAKQLRTRLGPEDWVRAARESLIAGGIAAVKIERLASDLGVTIGSFYWHFQNRQALLSALLNDWKAANTAAMIAAASQSGTSAEERFDAFVQVWISEENYSPAYDSAVRDWARVSAPARAAVHEADLLRVSLLQQIFFDMGYDVDRAEVRARITYFHQVGYYALDLRDDQATRLRLRPLYTEALRDGPGKKS